MAAKSTKSTKGRKKEKKENQAFLKLKADISAGTIGTAYIFYGEESYLREYYLGRLKKQLIPAGYEDFNCHIVEGKGLNIQELADMAEAMPMMAERTYVEVTDLDLFKLPGDQREKLIAFLEDVPPYCCVVFVYNTVKYKPDRTMKKLCRALEAHVEAVEFQLTEGAALTGWVSRHFREQGKEIDRQTAEYLVFLCGNHMTGLVQEIAKIATYARGPAVTQKDIDDVASPVLSAEVFKLSDAVLREDYDKAASILGDLLKAQTEPIRILGALGNQLRRIWTARIGLDSGRDKYWLMDLWDMKYESQASRLMSAARRADAEWCAGAVKMCQVLDRRMKSQRGVDSGEELKLLLARLGASRT